MDQKQLLRRTALHEASHGLLGAPYGFTIDWLRADPGDGETAMVLPFQPWQLPTQYRAAPRHTRERLTQIVGTLVAPYIVLNIPTDGGDLADLQEWRNAWELTRCTSNPPGPHWFIMHRAARAAVRQWLDAPGRRVPSAHLLVVGSNSPDAGATWFPAGMQAHG
jgi:hypothetical protein